MPISNISWLAGSENFDILKKYYSGIEKSQNTKCIKNFIENEKILKK
jgi:hypothetical protein